MDEYIKGIFCGVLLACYFMLVASKPEACTIEVRKGNVTTVTIGTRE